MQARLVSVASLVWCLLAAAHARVAPDYATQAEALDGGGGSATSSSYGGSGSIGMIAGISSSAAYGVEAGYLPQIGNPPAGPEIAVFDGAGTSPAAERQSHSGSFLFANTPVGSGTLQTFTLANTGTEILTGLTLTTNGSHPGDFTPGAPASVTLAPGATTTFTVTFSPTVLGARSAALQIASSDPDENPFVIHLGGNHILTAGYANGSEVPLLASAFTATGSTVNLSLNYAPTVGTELTVVKITGAGFITGAFNNLAQGQSVALSFGGTTYAFVANYYGGNGNDLVLVWAANRSFDWGQNLNGQLGDNTTTQRNAPVLVTATGILAGKTVVALATGSAHSMALCSDGTLAAWGGNDSGQLGDGTTTRREAPVAVATAGTPLAGRTVVAIAAGDGHSLALCSDGTVAAWGYNAGGQLGDGSVTPRTSPVSASMAGRTAVAIAAGRHHSLALCSDGTLSAWGLNVHGELGDNTSADRTLPVSVTTAGTPLAGRTVVAIAAGAYHSLALCSDNTLAAWGDNSSGQLGDNSLTQRSVPVAVTVGAPLAGKTIASIAAGSAHSLARCSDNSLAAWGSNASGQLGTGFSGQQIAQMPVPMTVIAQPGVSALFGKTVVGIAAGANHCLAICADGTMAAWGNNATGQLGDNSLIARSAPVAVSTGALVPGERFIRAGSGCYADHSLALATSPPLPEIKLFTGVGFSLADERQSNVGTVGFPAAAIGSTNTTQTFTIKNSGTATLSGLVVTPAGANPGDFTPGPPGATSLPPGASTTFAVIFTPTALGARSAALQIASSDADENPFVIHLSGTGVTVIASYHAATDVPVTANSYTATGGTVNFALNYAPAPGTELMVVKNTGLGFIAGTFANLAQGQAVELEFDGVTYPFVVSYFGGNGNDLVLVWAANRSLAWGQNANGQLGDNSTTPRSVPTPVAAAAALVGKTVVAHALGQTHSLALCADGTLVAWGQNNFGQLGDGTTTQRNAPVPVITADTPLAGQTVVAIAAGTSHSMALCSNGTLVTWGSNTYGQLGDGTTTNRLLPTAVATAGTPMAGKAVVRIAAGMLHSLALCSDGKVFAWGYNLNGQLGNSTGSNSNLPVAVTTSGVLSGRTVVSISSNVNHTLALCSDGTLAAWGYNFAGQIGDGSFGHAASRYWPVAVTISGTVLAGKTVVATATGEHHSLALCSDGTLAAWGQNSSGQIGNGTTSDVSIPLAVTTPGTALALKTPVAIAAGTSHSLALCADGTLAAWGKNNSGQLGDGTTTQRNLAVAATTPSLPPGDRIVRVCSGSYADHNLMLVASAIPPVLSALESWRLTHFNDSSNSGDGADPNDFDHDGIVNLIEYAFGLHPKQNSAGQLPQALRTGGDGVINFTEPAGVSGVTYGAEASATLQPGSWISLSDTGIPPQHTFSVPLGTNETHFLRLKVTSP